ncbi:transposase [Paraburkholderia youngii]
MGKPIIDDELWTLIEPLLPPAKPRRFKYPGRKPVPDRAALTGILFVLKTGIRWRDLPPEMGCGSGVSCWRRLRDWQQAGVWDRLHAMLLARLRAVDKIDFSRVVVDSSSIRAIGAGENWSEPHRLSATRVQAPPRHRRQRNAHRGNPDGCQS